MLLFLQTLPNSLFQQNNAQHHVLRVTLETYGYDGKNSEYPHKHWRLFEAKLRRTGTIQQQNIETKIRYQHTQFDFISFNKYAVDTINYKNLNKKKVFMFGIKNRLRNWENILKVESFSSHNFTPFQIDFHETKSQLLESNEKLDLTLFWKFSLRTLMDWLNIQSVSNDNQLDLSGRQKIRIALRCFFLFETFSRCQHFR